MFNAARNQEEVWGLKKLPERIEPKAKYVLMLQPEFDEILRPGVGRHKKKDWPVPMWRLTVSLQSVTVPPHHWGP